MTARAAEFKNQLKPIELLTVDVEVKRSSCNSLL